MAVVSHQETAQHAVANFKPTGTNYTAPYDVTVDSARTGPGEIHAYFEAQGLGLNTPFSYADEGDAFSFCKSINPVRKAGSVDTWLVTLQYEPLTEEEEQQDEDGNPTDNPTQWRLQHSFTTSTFSVPVWQAWNITAFDAATGYQRPANTLGPVINSAGVVLDPPLMRNEREWQWRVIGYLEDMDVGWTGEYVNAINSQRLEFHTTLRQKYGFQNKLFEPYELKVLAANTSYRNINNQNVWEYEYIFGFRQRATATTSPDPRTSPVDGWLEEVLDRGISRSKRAGDPDGAGGAAISASDIEDGMAVAGPIKDLDGNRTPEMVLLDGGGQPLQGGDAVYFTWRLDDTELLTALPLPLFEVV